MSQTLGLAALLLTLVVVAGSFAVRSPLGRFKPVPVMLLIFASYNALPFLAVAALPELAELMLSDAYAYYRGDTLLAIASLSLGCVTAGLVGLLVGSAPRPPTPGKAMLERKVEPDSTQRRRLVLGACAFALFLTAACVLVWTLRGFLFAGYHEAFGENQGEVLLRGSLSSLFTLLFVSYLFTWFANDCPARSLQRRRGLFWISTMALLGVGLALLSLGGRLYGVSAIVTVLAMRAVQAAMRGDAPGSALKLWGTVGLLLATVAAIGVWRVQNDFNTLAVLINLLAEPLFVSISLTSLFGANTVPALDFPSLLLTDAIGILPSAVYPDKLDRLFAIADVYRVDSPAGGLNGLASLSANFGWLGAIAVSGVLCFVVARLSFVVARRQASPPLRLVYVIAVTFPLLSLCRDPYVISVYKNLLQNSLVWPLLLAYGGKFVWLHRTRPAPHASVAGMPNSPGAATVPAH